MTMLTKMYHVRRYFREFWIKSFKPIVIRCDVDTNVPKLTEQTLSDYKRENSLELFQEYEFCADAFIIIIMYSQPGAQHQHLAACT